MKKVNCILLVDDNPFDNKFHQMIIRKSGLCDNIMIANDGLEALAYLRKSHDPAAEDYVPLPDLVFLDISMPRMNGFEFLNEYRNLHPSLKKAIVVVMLTTSASPFDKKRALDTGEVKEFYSKPLSELILRELEEKYFTE